MLENREITKRIFPEMFSANVSMVVNYPMILHNILVSLPRNISKPNVVLMTPEYIIPYEHTFLARQMGIP
jgi:uncharacterized circularly permuted ATP-grasp superfamily protein